VSRSQARPGSFTASPASFPARVLPEQPARFVHAAHSARLRARGTGYAVSLIKAGVELAGYSSGGGRPPLSEVAPAHRDELARILAAGLAAVPGQVPDKVPDKVTVR